MRKNFLLIIPLLTLCLSSCGLDRINSILSNEAKKITEMNEKLIKCLTTKDQTSFKELFCDKVKTLDNFDQQVNDVFSYFNCEIYIDSQYDTVASGGQYTEYGKIKEWDLYPSFRITTLITKTEEEMVYRHYEFDYYWVLENDQDESTIGIHYLDVCLLNYDNPVSVGTFDYQLK